jgi:hypothetical protein
VAKWRSSPKYYAVFTIVALGIAAICFLGVVLEGDLVGRIIFGTMWSLVAVYWLGRYIHTRRTRIASSDSETAPKRSYPV